MFLSFQIFCEFLVLSFQSLNPWRVALEGGKKSNINRWANLLFLAKVWYIKGVDKIQINKVKEQ